MLKWCKTESLQLIFGLVVIIIITGFCAYFIYMNEPIGDDVLAYYTDDLGHYLDDYDTHYVALYTRMAEARGIISVLYSVLVSYLYWGGRVTGYFFGGIGRLLPKEYQAVLTAFIYSTSVFCSIRIIYKNSKECLKRPIIFLVMWFYLYWAKSSVSYTYMWTMVGQYSIPILFVLVYYNLAVVDYEKTKKHPIWQIQIVGLLAGMGHEVISLLALVTVVLIWVDATFFAKQSWKLIFRHSGLMIGYCVGFCAPGNFNRLHQSHDSNTLGFYSRLKNSCINHFIVLCGSSESKMLFVLMLVLSILVVLLLIWKKQGDIIAEVIHSNIGIISIMVLSIPIYAFMPKCPLYGLDLWLVSILVFFASFMYRFESIIQKVDISFIKTVCAIVLMLAFGMRYFSEIRSYFQTSYERQRLIEGAVAYNQDEVVVPKYDSHLSYRYRLDYLNDQAKYDTDYYIAYYGTHVIVQE